MCSTWALKVVTDDDGDGGPTYKSGLSICRERDRERERGREREREETERDRDKKHVF